MAACMDLLLEAHSPFSSPANKPADSRPCHLAAASQPALRDCWHCWACAPGRSAAASSAIPQYLCPLWALSFFSVFCRTASAHLCRLPPAASRFTFSKLKRSKKVLMKLKGNVTGQIRHIPAHTSVVMPDNTNYRFWDAETHMEIAPRRRVIVNKQGFFE